MAFRSLVHVRNIPWTVSRCELERYFSAFGGIKRATIVFNENGLSSGNGFVEFYDASAMNAALNQTHVLEESELHVFKRTSEQRVN